MKKSSNINSTKSDSEMSDQLQEILIIRLNTTEDIIAIVEDNEDDTVTVKNPMLIEIEFNGPAKQQLMFLRNWLPVELLEENSAVISKTNILTKLIPSEDFYEYYIGVLDDLENKQTKKEKLSTEGDLEKLTAILEAEGAKANNRLH